MSLKYKIELVDDNGQVKKTHTVNDGNANATDTDFRSAGNVLSTAYDLTYSQTIAVSDTVVHKAE